MSPWGDHPHEPADLKIWPMPKRKESRVYELIRIERGAGRVRLLSSHTLWELVRKYEENFAPYHDTNWLGYEITNDHGEVVATLPQRHERPDLDFAISGQRMELQAELDELMAAFVQAQCNQELDISKGYLRLLADTSFERLWAFWRDNPILHDLADIDTMRIMLNRLVAEERAKRDHAAHFQKVNSTVCISCNGLGHICWGAGTQRVCRTCQKCSGLGRVNRNVPVDSGDDADEDAPSGGGWHRSGDARREGMTDLS